MVLQTDFAQEAQEMLSTKTRRKIILAIAASASIGVAPVAPAVSEAQAIPGKSPIMGATYAVPATAIEYGLISAVLPPAKPEVRK